MSALQCLPSTVIPAVLAITKRCFYWTENFRLELAANPCPLTPDRTCAVQLGMSALGHKRTCAPQKAMSALHPIATAKADMCQWSCLLYPRKRTCAVHAAMSALGQ
jgi:hypothetical protein